MIILKIIIIYRTYKLTKLLIKEDGNLIRDFVVTSPVVSNKFSKFFKLKSLNSGNTVHSVSVW